jgi:hypothetical protein
MESIEREPTGFKTRYCEPMISKAMKKQIRGLRYNKNTRQKAGKEHPLKREEKKSTTNAYNKHDPVFVVASSFTKSHIVTHGPKIMICCKNKVYQSLTENTSFLLFSFPNTPPALTFFSEIAVQTWDEGFQYAMS